MTGKVNLALLPSPKHLNSFICLFACLLVCLFLPHWCAETSLLDFWASTKTLSSVRDYIKQPWISRAPRPWTRGAGSRSQATVVSVIGTIGSVYDYYPVHQWVIFFLSPLVYGSHSPHRGTFVYEWIPNYCCWEENMNEGHLPWLPCWYLEPSFLILLASLLFDTAPYTSFWFNVCRGYCWLKLGPHILLGYLCLGPIILFSVWKIIPPPTVEAKRNLFPSKEVSGDAVSLA